MPKSSVICKTASIDDVAQLLSQVVDARPSAGQSDKWLDEISQLLWAITDLDPDSEFPLKHSNSVTDLVARSTD